MKRKNKNAFTLIELLAVIVILAIIALIATPIILGIVEDARRDAFLRSVELVISTTDLDVAKKNIQEGYTYTIEDGNISNLEIGVKNTNGMNGSITYDANGKEVYAIHNGVYCVIKTEDMDKAELKDYVEGKCELSFSMGVLETIQSKVPNENDVVTFTNGQLINLGEYGIRYQGYDPDNYIYFNCEDYFNQTSDTCELWRIIGVVDGKVKIISEQMVARPWDENIDDVYDNNWSDSSLKTYLNGYYLNSLNTKNAKTGEMISPSTWHLRGTSVINITKNAMYNVERTTGTVMYETPFIENTKIGLMYPSDWGFAAMETENCLPSANLNAYQACKESNWINQGITINHWLITVDSSDPNFALTVVPSGSVNGNSVFGFDAIRPVLYLTSNIEFEGEGTPTSPYRLQAK